MEKFVCLAIVFLFAFLLFIRKDLPISRSVTSMSSPGMEEGERPNGEWMWMQRAYPVGNIPEGVREGEWASLRKKRIQARGDAPLIPIGPTNVGGRITDVEIADSPQATWYVGSASGGIFRSTDQGGSWTPIFDDNPVLPIGDIALAPTDAQIIYVGTGEPNAGGGSIAYEGRGVFVSRDGGDSWEPAGLLQAGSIGQLAVDPRDDNRVFAAAMGPLYRKGGQRGIYMTEDGGKHWTLRLAPATDSTGFIQVLIDPLNPEVLYAVAWERYKHLTYRHYGGVSSAIYRSEDGGATWGKLNGGLPTSPKGFGRISLAVAPSQPNILYALYLDVDGYLYGLYRSSDSGNSWSERQRWSRGGISYNYWFGGLRVSPVNPNIVYRLGFFLGVSEDGGLSWTATDKIHVDQHAMAFLPDGPNQLLVGNDGGLYRSEDGGQTFDHYDNLPITQFYKIHVDPHQEQKIYCGSQDNNTLRTTTGSPDDYESILGGDGFQARVHLQRPDRVYAEYQYGALFRSDDDADHFIRITNGIQPGEPVNWSFPYVLAPHHPDVMYCGTNRIYQSLDGGDHWRPVSPLLPRKVYGGNQRFGTITDIDVSILDEGMICAGTDDGRVWSTTDTAQTWEDITENLPRRWVTRVLSSHSVLGGMWVSLSGYRYGPNDGHVFYRGCARCSWENRTFDLPNVPVNDLEEHPDVGLLAATDLGVFLLDTFRKEWVNYTPDLPPVIVTDIAYSPATRYLYIGTYGRSGYKVHVPLVTGISPVPVSPLQWRLRSSVSLQPPILYFVPEGAELSSEFEVVLSDIKGKVLHRASSLQLARSGNRYAIPIDRFAHGVYVLQVRIGAEVRSSVVCW